MLQSLNQILNNPRPAAVNRQDQPAASLRADINKAKRLFADVAEEVCPGFTFRADHNQAYNDLLRWCIMSPGPLDPDRGLLLYGNVGTGKSTLLEIVRRFAGMVRPRKPDGYPYSFLIKNAVSLCAAFQAEGYAGIEPFLRSRYLAVDELGSETIPTMYYGSAENVLQHILQSRYGNRFTHTTHVTTNLDPQQIAQHYGDRIYDRCKELFNFVPLMGTTNRHTY